MDDLLAGRLQMATSLGFHIIFASISMVMPFFMAVAQYRWLKTGNATYKLLAKSWAKGVAIFFAIGAVSGTMLSFELGLLWPGFMVHAGPIIGMPFSLEGTFFFLEAIALGMFLYGWDRLPQWVHFGSGVVVGIAGVASGVLVVAANSWMNSPSGFDWVGDHAENIDPMAAMANAAWFTQALHMTLAAFFATSFAVAGLHAWLRFKRPGNELHAKAFGIAMPFAVVAAFLMPLSGDLAAKDVAIRQPAKLAAMEAHFHTERNADLILGGLPDPQTQTVPYALRIPGGLSFLAHGDFNAEVTGLDRIPADEHPPVVITHIAFQIMVGIGTLMVGVAGLYLIALRWRRRWLTARWFATLLLGCVPLGFVAIEAGWTVTEVGRQPWILYGILRTADSLTPMPGLVYTFWLTTTVYVVLAFVAAWLLTRQIRGLSLQFDRAHAPLTQPL
ncbi:MAG: cytochrome ubiquinol oxidase subunit I [Bacteroidia bacterium]|nr:cytochrome ubiquinol oxidase subunit I [Bacteroidia bacterium]